MRPAVKENKMSKLSLKKITVMLLSAAGLSALTVGTAGCVPKSTELKEPENAEITRLTPPTDGSLPTAHTCAENLGYVAAVFDSQTQYHSYSFGVTSASIATQTTRNFRDFKDGVLINSDLTYSSMVKSGTQTCTIVNDKGEPETYFRTSGAPEADTLPAQAQWSEEAPTYFSERAYHYTYGLIPTELFNYIVNEQTIIDSEQIKVNADGTYTQSFTLDPVASTYYYQFGMKTRGGLSGFPEFKSITFSVTFDGGWRILSATMHEVANVNKGIVVSSVSDFSTQFWYGDDHFDNEHFGFYDSYFKKYLGAQDLEQGGSSSGGELVVDVTNVLSNGFSGIMNGGDQYEIALDLGKNHYEGYIYLSLDLADPLESLALKASLGKSLKEQSLYIEYGNGGLSAYYGRDFALTANLAEVKIAVGQLGGVIENISKAFAKGGQSSAEGAPAAAQGDPVSELMNAMELVSDDKQAVLTLNTDDLLGLGIGVNARLSFGINNNKITFRGASVSGLSIGGEALDMGVKLYTTTAPEIERNPQENAADLSEYIADVGSLLGSDILKVSLTLDGSGEQVKIGALKNVSADATAYADIDGVSLGAEAEVSYTYNGVKKTAKASVWYGWDPLSEGYGQAAVTLYEFGGAPVNLSVKCDVAEVAEAVGSLITFAGGTGAEESGLVAIINGALSSDFSSLITELYADKTQIKAGVSVDAILSMLGVKTGMEFGSCGLRYVRGEGVYGGSLSATLPALGFGMTVSGADGGIEKPDLSDCLDLNYVIGDVLEIANADLLKVNLKLDGSAEGVAVKELSGLTADVALYVNTQNVAVGSDMSVAYTLGGNTVSAKLTAYYGGNGENEGRSDRLVLSLNEINGVPVYAKVGCYVSEITQAVNTLLSYANVTTAPFDNVSFDLSSLIDGVMRADWGKLLPVLTSGADSLNVSLDIDEALGIFGVKTGLSFGNANLLYSHSGEDKFVAKVPALGLSATVSGAEGKIEAPAGEVFDLTNLINTVNSAWGQVNAIKAESGVAFSIPKGETYLSLDGIRVEICGDGEVSWKEGREYVALDLGMSITETATDTVYFKFIYDKNSINGPLVKLALNDVGIEIYNEDIDGVKAAFGAIYEKISALLGKSAQPDGGTAPDEGEKSDGNAELSYDKLINTLFGVLASGDWVEFLNNFTATCDGKSVALSYLSDNAANITVGTDGALSLYYDGAFGDFSLGGGVEVTPSSDSLIPSLDAKFKGCKMSSTKTDGNTSFIKLAYDYLFSAISSIDVSNILGSNTYAVTFRLDGGNTNIAELKDVFVDAELYVTGAKDKTPKLAEGSLNLNVSGVTVNLNVVTERNGENTHFYINLSQVADVKLPDLKFLATQESLYDTFEVLFTALNNEKLLNSIGSLIGGKEEEAPAQADGKDALLTQSQIDALADLLANLMKFDFNRSVVATTEDGVTTAAIDLDDIVKQLGIKTAQLGTLEAVIDHNSHSMTTSGKALVVDSKGVITERTWISLSSEKTARRDYSGFNRAEYISIEFLPTLLEDALKTVTDEDGELRTKYTLSGKVNAQIDIKVYKIDIALDVTTLTVNLDGDNGLYFSLMANLSGDMVTKRTIGLTYQGGYLTLGRDLQTSAPQYRVMSFEYFLGNMFDKDSDKSTLNWLLGVSDFIWGIAAPAIKNSVPIDTGAMSTQDVYLYNVKASQSGQTVSMYDYIDALAVITDGKKTASIGDISPLANEFGLEDNYYGAALNAKLLTGGVLSKLYAAITRTPETGFDRVKASGAIDSIVSFSADLQFKNGWTEDYVIGTENAGGKCAPSLYDYAMAETAKAGNTPDFDHIVKKPAEGYDEVFGCFNVTVKDGSAQFATDYVKRLYSHKLTVIGLDGVAEERSVRHGSTVYMYDNEHPAFTDEGKEFRLLYSLSPDGVGASSAVMEGDMTVYALRRKAVTVVVHSGSNTYELSTYAGGSIPDKITGLDKIGTLTYADGTPVQATDVADGSESEIHVYGTFVETEVEVNDVIYKFDANSLTYTAAGKGNSFDNEYSVNGKTLALENEIGGYAVTAIAPNAFANVTGKPIKRVIVPENIVTVGENAFRDNTDMEYALFLAENVTMLGKDGKDKTMPFYGCSISSDDEKTDLTVYYNNITSPNGNWRHFRYVSKVISFNFYIGDNGGKTYSEGQWQKIDYAVNVDLNGVTGSALTAKAVSDILAPCFPVVRTEAFEGSAEYNAVISRLEKGLADFDIVRGGITYTAVYTVDIATVGCEMTVTYNVTYKRAATVSVTSPFEMVCGGVTVAAGATVDLNVPVEGDSPVLPVPTSRLHIFEKWETKEINGKLYCTAEWREKNKYSVTLSLPYKAANRSSIRVDGVVKANSTMTSGANTTIELYEGTATFTVKDNVLTIDDGVNVYVISVTEIDWKGKVTENKRSITSDITGEKEIGGAFTVNLNY